MKITKETKQKLILGAQIVYFLLFYLLNRLMATTSAQIPRGWKVLAVVLTMVNFVVCLFLIKGKLLTKRTCKSLLLICIAFVFNYLLMGTRTLFVLLDKHINSSPERLVSFFLCTAEILYRAICVAVAANVGKKRKDLPECPEGPLSKWLIIFVCFSIFTSLFPRIITFSPRYEPNEGIWFCEELQIQLDYSGKAETFVIESGAKIQCGCGSDRGIKEIRVYCQEFDHPTYKLAELIFCADIKKLTDRTLTVVDPQTEQEYVFVRTDLVT